MLATVVLAVLLVHLPVQVSNAPRPLHQASLAPDPLKPEQPWPPPGVYRANGEVSSPKVTKQVPPNYSAAAMKAKVEGSVLMEAVVLTDGTVGDVRVVQSLDKEHGLDDVAVETVKKWRFIPGKKDGVPVPVVVEVRMAFSLRGKRDAGGTLR